MKKFLAILLVVVLAMSATTVFAADDVTVMLDGVVIDCKTANGDEAPPFIVDGTTYLPVRAIAKALDLDVQWDDATKSVFINGVSVLAKKTDVINIFIDGGKFTAKDANGNVVNPIIKDGTTYLPVRAIGEAFDKEVSWDGNTKTVTLTTVAPKIVPTVIEEGKIYAFINKDTGKALTATDHYTLEHTDFTGNANQGFKFTQSDISGYYFIQSVFNHQQLDVSGQSIEAGGEIITWEATGADNQKFTVKDVEGGALVYSFSSSLPIQATGTNTIQADKTEKDIQKWEIKEINPTDISQPPVAEGNYRTFTTGSLVLSDSDTLCVSAPANAAYQKWNLVDMGNNEYVITNVSTGRSIDVSGQSLNAGDPIITWETNSDPNQRWILEDIGDGLYLIKSVHSGLYLTVASDNTLIQTFKNTSSASQKWKMEKTN